MGAEVGPPSFLSNHGSLFPRPNVEVPISLDQALLRVDLSDEIPQGINTGEDAVTLLMREKHREGQAFYCVFTNRDPLTYDPFDLTVVKRTAIKPSTAEYFTVTVSGVTFIRDGDICEVQVRVRGNFERVFFSSSTQTEPDLKLPFLCSLYPHPPHRSCKTGYSRRPSSA